MKPFNSIEAESLYKSYDAEPTIPIYAGSRYQKGHGIRNIFSGLLKAALPLVKKGALSLGKTALKTGVNIAQDSLSGKDLKSTLKDNLRLAGKDILSKSTAYITEKQSNKSRKRTRSTVTSKAKAKRKRPRLTNSDIFTK